MVIFDSDFVVMEEEIFVKIFKKHIIVTNVNQYTRPKIYLEPQNVT